jgi:hypothetical protein
MLGAKNAIFAPFIYKTIILPRPAQDQLRENSKKSGVLRSGGGGRAWDGVLWCLGEWREASVVTAKHRCGAKQRVPIDYFIRLVMVPSLSWQSISSTLCNPPLKSQCPSRPEVDSLQGTFAIVGWIKPHRCFTQEWSSTRRWRMISQRISLRGSLLQTIKQEQKFTVVVLLLYTWYNIVLVQKVLRGAAWLALATGAYSTINGDGYLVE